MSGLAQRIGAGWGVYASYTRQNLTPALAESLDITFRDGVLISGVLEDGPGDQAGLQPGDVIVEIDGQPVAGALDMLRRVAGEPPGTPASIGLMRKNEQIKPIAIVGERPSISGLR